ncbi:extracellular solute-binding protein family 1 [Thermobaculum terrenum ATCC BAA-798]|uniref:Extracellular solute-binding protein family 1 n=2 Tax=Thermobaculum TaxID=262406 RepID=D1CH88_THET1|nr:extracellular solute-binding protein family 1 [Thermobaculum terrenum ATCC BAA-798]
MDDLRELIEQLSSGRISRREFIRKAFMLGLSASAIGSILAACGGGAGSTPTAGTSGGAASSPSPSPSGSPKSSASAPPPTPTPYKPQSFGSKSAKVKIRYWTILSSVDGIVMNDLVRKFTEENPDIAVESLQGLTDFIQKMQAAAISGTAPDVALVRHTYIGPFALKNVLSELQTTELEEAGIKAEDYYPEVWKFTQFEGKQYTVPLDMHCHAMLYNKKILQDNNVSVPTTLDEWTAVVEKVSKDGIIGYQTFALGAGAQEYLTWYWYGIHKQFGGEMLSEDGTKAAFNTPEGIEAVKWMKDIQQKGNPKNAAITDLARTGKVATWPDGPWISTLYFNPEKSPAAKDIDVVPLPQHDPKHKAVWGQSHQLALPRQQSQDQARREASLRFIEWITRHSVDWAKAGQIPARNSARQEALQSNDRYLMKLRAWAKQLPYLKFMPIHPAILEIMPRIAANVEGAILGRWSVEQGLKQAENEVNQILARSGQ